MSKPNLSNQINQQQLWVGKLSKEERSIVLNASKILGLRKSAFYKQAIIEKAQSVLSSSNKESHEEASPAIDLVDGASFLSGGEK